MPASLDKNLLAGYLKEELGVYLLRGLATVAPVPRPQDAGIDAIATLLRQSTTRKLVPENTFYVQIKPSHHKRIKFSGEEISWLCQLQLPYFVGCVDQEKGQIALYSAHRWTVRSQSTGRITNLALLLEPPLPEVADPHHVFTIVTPGNIEVRIGPPVLSWSVAEMAHAAFLSRAYSILKPHLTTEDRNIRWRQSKYSEKLEWETNQPPQPGTWSLASHALDHLCGFTPGDSLEEFRERAYALGLRDILAELTPSFLALLMHILYQGGSRPDWEAAEAFLQFMRSHGNDPVPGDWFVNIARRRFGIGDKPS